jgi:cytochrome c-type biogenesis protein CcmH
MGFWLAAGAISLLVAFLILLAFLRPRAGATPAAAYDLQVYRDQLKEVDRDVERGILTEAEAARARTEVSRRILEADRALQKAEAAEARRGGFDRWIIAGGLVAVVAGPSASISRSARRAIPTCRWPPASRIIDEARATRPGQAEAEAQVTMREACPSSPSARSWWRSCAPSWNSAPTTRRAWRFWRRTRPRWAISAPRGSRRSG